MFVRIVDVPIAFFGPVAYAGTLTWQLLSIPKDKPTISLNPTGLDLPQPQFSIRDTLRFGRVGVLTPWGVLTFGGRSSSAHYMDPPVVWRVRRLCCAGGRALCVMVLVLVVVHPHPHPHPHPGSCMVFGPSAGPA
jgi:hypothetical protein